MKDNQLQGEARGEREELADRIEAAFDLKLFEVKNNYEQFVHLDRGYIAAALRQPPQPTGARPETIFTGHKQKT